MTFPVAQSRLSLTKGGTPILIDTYQPEGDGQRFAAIIGLHGSGGGHDTMGATANPLAAEGFAVFVPHYFDRTGTTVADKASSIRNFPLWMKALWDVTSLVAEHSAVDPDRIGILGFSLGGYLATSLAAIDARLKAAVEFSGGFPREMKLFMRRLAPTLIIHGEGDDVIPVSEAHHLQELLANKNTPHELQIYPGEGHHLAAQARSDADRRTIAFFKKHLAPAGDSGTFSSAGS
jgi:carboxymethylenebutenolidase